MIVIQARIGRQYKHVITDYTVMLVSGKDIVTYPNVTTLIAVIVT